MPGCEALGEYRAPKSRRNLGDYWWFCLEHVRAYNSTWDYYKGMSPGEIEAQLRADTAWQRPSWPLGRLGSTSAWDEALVRDPLHLLDAGRVKRGTSRAPEQLPLNCASRWRHSDWPGRPRSMRSRHATRSWPSAIIRMQMAATGPPRNA